MSRNLLCSKFTVSRYERHAQYLQKTRFTIFMYTHVHRFVLYTCTTKTRLFWRHTSYTLITATPLTRPLWVEKNLLKAIHFSLFSFSCGVKGKSMSVHLQGTLYKWTNYYSGLWCKILRNDEKSETVAWLPVHNTC